MEKRCIESLWMQFEFLKDMERNTDLTAHQCEVQFKELLFASEDIPIEINGFIDRIDANKNLLRVIDYKSSFKSLSAAKLEAGLQLQLITYFLIAIKKFDRKPAGAYYYSMKNPDIQIEAAKLNLRSFELSENTEEQWYLEWIKAHRLSGKTTDSSMETDNSGTHIVGWNQKGPSKAQLQDFKELETTLMELYHLLKKRLLNGEIDCTPTEGACLFCDYAGICRYSGQLYKRNVTKDELGREREDHA